MLVSQVDEGCCFFAAEVLLNKLDAISKEIEGVYKAEDKECIHQMRVASRRFRSALRAFKECFPDKVAKKWMKQVRRLARTLGTARDLDVQIEFVSEFLSGLKDTRCIPGVKRLLLRLSQQRESIQPEVISAVQKFESSGLIQDIRGHCQRLIAISKLSKEERFPLSLYQKAYAEIFSNLQDFLSFEQYVDHPEQPDKLHAMRIACKRLRYTMEIFSKLFEDGLKDYIEDAKAVQTLLGNFNDCVVWIRFLDKFLEDERARTIEYYGDARPFSKIKPGIIYVKEDRMRQRDQCYEDFIEFWRERKQQGSWNRILEIVQQAMPSS